ncbi:cytochrome P450 [Mycena vulgaris]|nr:cytochrome P450 [Mycena vulgaris]
MIAPGLTYLTQNALLLATPAASGVLLLRQLAASYGILIPTWALICLAGSSIPLYTALRLALKHRHHRREAAALGARLAPTSSNGKWPGNLDLLIEMQKIWKTGYPGDGLREVAEVVGPVVDLRVLWDNIILTIHPEHIKIILATDFNNYVKGEKFQYGMSSVLGTGVFNSDGEMWKFHRSMTRPFFSRDRISHFDIFDRHADRLDLVGRFTMDSATEFLFGSCVNSLYASLPFPHHAPVAAETEPESAHAQVATCSSPPRSTRRCGPMKVVSAYIDPLIHDAVAKKKLAAPLGMQEKAEGRDPKVLKDETSATSHSSFVPILTRFPAGKDTTQWTTTVIVYFLAMYPKVNSRLREEVLQHVGPSRRPTYDDIRDMKYLRAVINEAMRLYPSVESINATTWPSPDPNEKPIYIPAGTQVPYSVLMMHRRKDLTTLLTNSFMFLPCAARVCRFNAGPRICLGQQYNEMSFVLIRLLQSFSSFALDADAFPPEARPPLERTDQFRPKMHLTMYSEGGMWLKMTEAGDV